MNFSILVRGGHVIDPSQDLNGPYDVGIQGETIVAVEEKLPADDADLVELLGGCWSRRD